MSYQIKSSDLSSMTAQERKAALDELVEKAKSDAAASRSVLDTRIRQFELRYEMPSSELRKGLRESRIKETAEIARWLFLLDARENCSQDHVAE